MSFYLEALMLGLAVISGVLYNCGRGIDALGVDSARWYIYSDIDTVECGCLKGNARSRTVRQASLSMHRPAELTQIFASEGMMMIVIIRHEHSKYRNAQHYSRSWRLRYCLLSHEQRTNTPASGSL